MAEALHARGIPKEWIHLFSADGPNPAADLAERDPEVDDFWLIEGTPLASLLNPQRLVNTTWGGVDLRPARVRELRRWFTAARKRLEPGDTLLVFVTDHGTRNAEDPNNGQITLWDQSLSVLEFRALLAHLRPGVRVVTIMSQCFSGAFASAMRPLDGSLPTGDVCGFFASTADRPAYGCYPEGRDRDRIGHAFAFIDALGRHSSPAEAHTAVLLNDATPDVPIRTSDVFLERLVLNEADNRGVSPDIAADALLERAWADRARWEPQIRLLDRMGQIYGTFSPRTLAELSDRINSLQALSTELDTYADRWRIALDDLRRENLERFRTDSPEWAERLEPKRIQSATAEEKAALLAEFLPALRQHGASSPDTGARLRDLHDKREDATTARYRTDIRLAALLRMRTILLRIAGSELIRSGLPPDWKPRARVATESAAAKPAEPLDNGPAMDGPDTAPAPGTETDPSAAAEASPGSGAPQAAAAASPADSHAETDDQRALDEADEPDDLPSPPGYLHRALDALEACEAAPLAAPKAGATEIPALSEKPNPLPPAEEDMAAVRRALPSWLGIQFRPMTDARRKEQELPRGAALVGQVYLDSPARQAGVQAGDIILGPPGSPFAEPNQLREWTMTRARGTPLELALLRDGNPLTVSVTLAPFPTKLPNLPAPPKVGDAAPPLGALKVVRPDSETTAGSGADSGARLLFFWATWCQPCKKSVPELMAWQRKTHTPILAVTDEEEPAVRSFLDSWTGAFPQAVATDETRRIQADYGVSGTPTFILVNGEGRIEWRQVGYSPKDRLSLPGWTWSEAPAQ